MSSVANTIPASEARKNFYSILDDVANKLKRFTITRWGRPQAVVMHPDEVEAWEETMEVMADKELVKDIKAGIKDIKEGKVISEQELLKDLGISKNNLD